MTLILRRVGRGNWSPLQVNYDASRQGQMPTLMHAKRGDILVIEGVRYRVSRVLP